MKTILNLIFAVIFMASASAQKNIDLYKHLTEKYADKDGFSASQISNDMFDLYLKKNKIDEKSPLSEALNSLDKITVVAQSNFNFKAGSGSFNTPDQNKNQVANDIFNEILEYYKNGNFSLLKTEKRMGEDVKVYLKKNQDKIETLALITNSSAATSLVELNGDIDLKTVSELSSALNLRGLENLYKIDNNVSRFGIYSNVPHSTGVSAEKLEEMLARTKELYANQDKLSAEQRLKIEEQAQMLAEKQAVMAEKYREMAEIYRRNPIFLNNPGDTNVVYYLDGKKVKAQKIKELDSSNIEKIEINKAKNDKDKSVIRITTK